jgi:hypothetical protein
LLALLREGGESRLMISEMVYPDMCRAGAKELARLPEPTIATRGFRVTGAAYHLQTVACAMRSVERD